MEYKYCSKVLDKMARKGELHTADIGFTYTVKELIGDNDPREFVGCVEIDIWVPGFVTVFFDNPWLHKQHEIRIFSYAEWDRMNRETIRKIFSDIIKEKEWSAIAAISSICSEYEDSNGVIDLDAILRDGRLNIDMS